MEQNFQCYFKTRLIKFDWIKIQIFSKNESEIDGFHSDSSNSSFKILLLTRAWDISKYSKLRRIQNTCNSRFLQTRFNYGNFSQIFQKFFKIHLSEYEKLLLKSRTSPFSKRTARSPALGFDRTLCAWNPHWRWSVKFFPARAVAGDSVRPPSPPAFYSARADGFGRRGRRPGPDRPAALRYHGFPAADAGLRPHNWRWKIDRTWRTAPAFRRCRYSSRNCSADILKMGNGKFCVQCYHPFKKRLRWYTRAWLALLTFHVRMHFKGSENFVLSSRFLVLYYMIHSCILLSRGMRVGRKWLQTIQNFPKIFQFS